VNRKAFTKLVSFTSMPNSDRMTVLFIGHGSPMNALEDNEFVQGFRNIAQTIPKPRAILCISAHWFIKGTRVTAMEMPRTIHDFYGFPKELYEQQYPAPGNPVLAKELQDLLQPTEVNLDKEWGLDHGTWSVLKHMYPLAEVPVLQLSIDYTQPTLYHFELAQRLQSLRGKGVLIIGSGNIVHNLRLVDFQNFEKDSHGFDWAVEARETINQYILDGNYQPLLDYQGLGESIRLAVPTPDHFLPLIYTLGLHKEGEKVEFFNDKLLAGSLSMTSLKIS
jgi:4,5-DOPA dioxygenase extradiol